MKKLLKLSFLFLLTLNFSACVQNEDVTPPELVQPATTQPNVDITLNDNSDIEFTAGTVYITDFNPGIPNTILLVIPDASSNIDLDGNNNLIGTGKNIKLFLKNTSGNLNTEITNAAKNNQYATYTLGVPANGADDSASYQNGEAIESPSIVDGFAGQVFIGDKIGNEYYIYVNARDPNNPNASIFLSLRASLTEFVY